MSDYFAVIIVGAGPAGCVLANRRGEQPQRRVLLLEAGPDYGPNQADWPAELIDSSTVAGDSHPWGYTQTGQFPAEPLGLPRAKVVGGTTTINGCLWRRGSAIDYDEWESLGNPGWGWSQLLPFFRKAENDPTGGAIHGSDGLVGVYRAPERDWSQVDGALLQAAANLGIPPLDDLNESPEQRPAAGPSPKNLRDGARMNAAFTYLAPARSRPNLTIQPNAQVARMLFDGMRAIGVITTEGTRYEGNEIVICGGAYGSPALLQRSGIGPRELLDTLQIPVVRELPGVGENLRDHPLVNGLMECAISPRYAPQRRSFMPIMIQARSKQTDREIDLHIYEGQSLDEAAGTWSLWLSVSLQHAISRGRVRIASTDPEAAPLIEHNFLSESADLEGLCDGVELAHNLVSAPPLAEMVKLVPQKSLTWRDREELRAKVQAQVGTTFHPSSTCKMGPSNDVEAVVDQEGRVHGVAGLRVVDASIFPTGPRGNLHWPVIAAAEKIATTF